MQSTDSNHTDLYESRGYQLLEIIGGGTFGKVNKAIHTATNEVVAIKQITLKNNSSRKHLIMLSREVFILYKLSTA
jgi:serine/threonine protein kinase